MIRLKFSTILAYAVSALNVFSALTLVASTSKRVLRGSDIIESGSYELAQNTYGPVRIMASNVALNLSGFRIIAQGSDNGLVVMPDINNVEISNGSIAPDAGISGGSGILLSGPNEGITIHDCLISGQRVCIEAGQANNSSINNCMLRSYEQAAVALNACRNVSVRGCQAFSGSSNASICGFVSQDGIGNIFEGCTVQGLQVASDEQGAAGAGFALTGNDYSSVVMGCTVNGCNARGAAQVAGVRVANSSFALWGGAAPEIATVQYTAWCCGAYNEYVAAGVNPLNPPNLQALFVYKIVEPGYHTPIAFQTQPRIYALSALAWCCEPAQYPDTSYLAVGTNSKDTTSKHLYLYELSIPSGPLSPIDLGNTDTPPIKTLSWCCNAQGSFLAVGTTGSTNSQFLYVYKLARDLKTTLSAITINDAPSNAIESATWYCTSSSAYLAIKSLAGTSTTKNIFVYQLVEKESGLVLNSVPFVGEQQPSDVNDMTWCEVNDSASGAARTFLATVSATNKKLVLYELSTNVSGESTLAYKINHESPSPTRIAACSNSSFGGTYLALASNIGYELVKILRLTATLPSPQLTAITVSDERVKVIDLDWCSTYWGTFLAISFSSSSSEPTNNKASPLIYQLVRNSTTGEPMLLRADNYSPAEISNVEHLAFCCNKNTPYTTGLPQLIAMCVPNTTGRYSFLIVFVKGGSYAAVTNNTVMNAHSENMDAVGIDGSGNQNLIMENVCYNNDINYAKGAGHVVEKIDKTKYNLSLKGASGAQKQPYCHCCRS